ncbi:Uncharacterized protein RSN1 [Candida viswanathii]|uniref:Uncharacterized protein RSN1 n=1 Tax=Candida viswanathii TaxID=5486 RepID=A0A367YDA0_9ASCO|nr:Uncharacterized protein RSN1 [Candida viswanathii]
MSVAPSSVSTSTIISTLVANLVLFGIFIGGFVLLRLKFKRIYSPKSSFDLVPEDKKPEPLPKDPIRWIFVLLSKPDSFFLQQAGLDGLVFLRYLKTFGLLFFFALSSYVILLPINATHGNNNNGFDKLSIANVSAPKRYYAHVVVGFIFNFLTIFVIYRELFFYNSIKNVVLSTPKYAKRLACRTVLFQSVPDALLDEKQAFKIFNGVKRVYVARTSRELEHKVEERANMVRKLEHAENKLMKAAVKSKMKADKKGILLEPVDEISSYVSEKHRPKTKEKGFFSKKVDAIRFCQEKIPELDKEVKRLQKKFRHSMPLNSIFVEFESQYYAQVAYQSTVHHSPMRMAPAFIGLSPKEIIHSNLRMFWWERITRRFLAFAAVTALVAFWAIPVAAVGTISNITFLTNKLPWLRWILKMPHALLGLVTGLLPTVLLSLLMFVLPMIIRVLARISGEVSTVGVEMWTQNAYFAFLMVNGFLVTALASSATATVTEIVEKPTSAMSILANKLPLSSNFYISYLVLQGFSIAGGSLFQIVGLFLYYILGSLFDDTVRKKWDRFSGLGSVSWGTVFPIFTQLACITLAYSIISPLILIFACASFFLIYLAYAHNITYCFVEGPDAYGSHYPRALFQSFVGLYLSEIVLLGILAVGKGWGPVVLQLIVLLGTIFAHIHLGWAFDHLLRVVPIDVMRPLDGVSSTSSFTGPTEYESKVLNRKKKHLNFDKAYQKEQKEEDRLKVEIKSQLESDNDLEATVDSTSVVPLLADRDFKSTNSNNPIVRFIRPDVYLNFRYAKKMIPAVFNVEPVVVDNKHAYDAPAISAKCPGVWFPADPMGLSEIEIEQLSPIVNISTNNATFNSKGKIVFLGKPPN